MPDKIAFTPTDGGRWFFDEDYDCLMLEIKHDMLFRSRYPGKMLIPDVFTRFPFSMDNAAAYDLFYDSCSILDLTEQQKIQLCLNAIIAANFLKPQMPKSWFFVQQEKPFMPNVADIVEVYMESKTEPLNLMVVEAAANASVCVVAQARLELENKTFMLAEVIKVMNDRLTLKPKPN